MTPYSFTFSPVISLHVRHLQRENNTYNVMYPKTKRKKYQTQSSQTMSVWLINHTASLSDMETTATERQSLPMPDFPIYPKSSTTLGNLFVPFCTQTEPVNKGIQKSHLSVHSNTTRRTSGQGLHCDLGSIAAL